MHMHGWQTDGKEINQTALFLLQNINTTLNKPLYCNNFLLQPSFSCMIT